jgi:hypothetical protein
MRYGKLPARINSVQLKLADYFDHATVLPKIPAEFGHEHLVASWDMLANDTVGDCVFAGAGHETVLWNDEASRRVAFTDESILSDYSAVTGYDPAQAQPDGSNPTDQGTDMQIAASYRRRIGILDATGVRHKVGGYVALRQGDPPQLAAAAYIFGAVGIGLRCPDYMEQEFAAGKPWDVRHGSPDIVGGHYVPVIGRLANGNFLVVTWGQVQQMTPAFYRRFCDEAVVYFSTEFMTAGHSPEGFDLAQLQTNLQAFTRR